MDADEIKKLDRMHIVHSWSVNSAVDPKVIEDVDGVYIIDSDGRRILDFSAQLICVNAGHNNRHIIAAIREQAEKFCYLMPGYACEPRSKLGKMLAAVTPGDLNRFFFTTGGAEANENAVKIARAYTGKEKILASYRCYHGATYGALSLGGDPRRPPVEPGIPGAVRFLHPYCYRCSFGLTYPQCNLQCAEQVAEIIQYETAETVAAVIIEPIVGGGGIIISPDGYLQRLREICDQKDVLLIADEVMTGFGRTGQWFGMQHWQVMPDLMTMAKGLTSSYVPLGAVALSAKVSRKLDQEMLYCGLTYSAHPLACAAGCGSVRAYQEDHLIENSRSMGKILKDELEKLKDRHISVGDVRSLGLFACLELVKNRQTKEPLVPYNASGSDAAITKEMGRRLAQKGVAVSLRWMFILIGPPLCINEDQLREGLDAIDDVLAYTDTLTDN